MGFEFTRSDRTVRAALRRIADEQAAAALKAAGGDGPLEPRVHAMRKSVKKMRGLIRLVRPAFDAFADENAALRDAARHLAPLREQDVLARTLAHLCADDPGLAGLDAL
ncbi:MAG: CHAD domain-containing protein, partial [Rhodobacteraceae bacterium]|nr:CHAD domain-containing protein [Paracoccaceae bacterium]